MLTFRIATRYLFSKKSHGAVNVISLISMAGVAVATAAIVIVLSVFNGFTTLAESQIENMHSPLSVRYTHGEIIANADSLCRIAEGVPGVSAAVPVLEERGLLISGAEQVPVVFRGVGEKYDQVTDRDKLVVAGSYMDSLGEMPAMSVMTGVANYCGLVPSESEAVDLYVPRRKGRINPANPAASYRGDRFIVTSVVQTQRMEYDADHVEIPLASARRLLEYTTEANAVDIGLAPGAGLEKVKGALSEILGGDYKVLGAVEQESEAFKMISVEKWITFALLSFILIVAAFNIFSTVSLLILEKRSNMRTLNMLGRSYRKLYNIFFTEGFLVTLAGGLVGVLLGVGLSLAQQYGGFIRLAGDASNLTTEVYPVKVLPGDILAVIGLLFVLGALSGLVSKLIASRLLKENN